MQKQNYIFVINTFVQDFRRVPSIPERNRPNATVKNEPNLDNKILASYH
jgi:hypothetical protein